MSDYSVIIKAQLEGFDEVEKKIRNITSKPVDVKIKLSGTDGDLTNQIQSQLSELPKQAKTIGSQMGDNLAQGLKSAQISGSIVDFTKVKEQVAKETRDVADIIKKNLTDSSNKGSVDGWAKQYVNSQIKASEQATKAAQKAAQQQTKELQKAAQQQAKELQKLFSVADTQSKGSTSSNFSAQLQSLESGIRKISSSTKNFDVVTNSINDARAAFDRFKQASANYANDRTDDNARELAKAYDDVTESIKNASNQMRELRAASSGIVDSKQLANFQKNVQQFYDSNTKMHNKYGQQVQNILTESMNSALSPSAFKNLQAQFAQVQKTISSEGLLGKGFFSEIKRGFEQIGQFVGTYGAWMQVVDVFRNMVTEVINVDTAMTELRKVSDASASEIDAYFSTAAASAKELGATISDVINSTADWTKLGYNLQDSAELARLTTLYQNIGDNMTQESAAESLVSTLQGFQLVPEEAEHIVDAFNEVGNRFAIGSDGIGEALMRSASSMNAAGNTLEETVGLVTAANTVVNYCLAA